ncbi:cyclopropane mycolic acid synthase family methyltransferase [Mycolicibacterium moriokaense]|uniref:Cyclopropane-fatty-acyl-phospholipid synthase n=1 Tax=Mycolicibacterium moriokaense TaxID=39691 RepID=A0A318H2U2_9MYCO|nr:cyclopropane mycolic acid synthase family methyltransferase [Mycolicibacterium moriokaense]PXW97678.1 cyclopropane-fatty-acyl-phospholipid synthase [Mycolicibacterium moriokaense]
MTELTPHFEDVQSHYDLSDDFYRLFLDPTQTYSCAFFERDDMSLEEAQIAKIDLSLGKLGLQPGMTLLDIGCGWGATMRRAVEQYDVNVIGLTLSENQHDHAEKALADVNSPRSMRVLLKGWEQFDEPVDRIVSIGAFEHFGHDRHGEFFKMAYAALPDDGVMLLHTICGMSMEYAREHGIPLTMELARLVRFIMREIFPGGQLCTTPKVGELAGTAGFTVTQTQSLQPDYARTLAIWADTLRSKRDEAVALTSEDDYDRYMTYLSGCAKAFEMRQAEVNQFTLRK